MSCTREDFMDSEHSHFSHKKTHPRQLGISIDRWGRNLVACCPFHAPEESSLFFYDALGYWRYRCLQCGNEGDLMEFVIRSRFNGLDEESAKLEAAEFFGSNKDAAEVYEAFVEVITTALKEGKKVSVEFID